MEQRDRKRFSTILIVDDEPLGLLALEAVLLSDFNVFSASSGQEALQLAAQIQPDLILLDVMMPGMDGFEVVRRIRLDPNLRDIPVFLVTALDDRDSRLRGIEAGADDFVTKPIDRLELLVRARTITRLDRYRRMLEERTRFEWVVEQAEEGYLLLDEHDQIIYANACARAYFTVTDAAIHQDGIMPTFGALAHALFTSEPHEIWKQWPHVPNQNPSHPLLLIRPETRGSSTCWLQVTVLDQPNSRHRLLRLQDITRHMSVQRNIWSFQSMIRHKLNTPLHIAQSSLELLTMQPLSELAIEEVEETVQWAAQGVQRLAGSVADVLAYSELPTLAQTRDELTPETLSTLAQKISREMGLEPTTTFLEIPQNAQPALSAQAMECIVQELLENARKFHPSRKPKTHLEMIPYHANSICVRLLDDGVNLLPDQISHLWTPYYQGEKSFTGEVPGMGLGLAMVRYLVWAVGGSCRICNRSDGPGVMVELIIPLIHSECTA